MKKSKIDLTKKLRKRIYSDNNRHGDIGKITVKGSTRPLSDNVRADIKQELELLSRFNEVIDFINIKEDEGILNDSKKYIILDNIDDIVNEHQLSYMVGDFYSVHDSIEDIIESYIIKGFS